MSWIQVESELDSSISYSKPLAITAPIESYLNMETFIFLRKISDPTKSIKTTLFITSQFLTL